jgi:hypothetical protein
MAFERGLERNINVSGWVADGPACCNGIPEHRAYDGFTSLGRVDGSPGFNPAQRGQYLGGFNAGQWARAKPRKDIFSIRSMLVSEWLTSR